MDYKNINKKINRAKELLNDLENLKKEYDARYSIMGSSSNISFLEREIELNINCLSKLVKNT